MAQALDFVSTINAVGCPVLRALCEGREPGCRPRVILILNNLGHVIRKRNLSPAQKPGNTRDVHRFFHTDKHQDEAQRRWLGLAVYDSQIGGDNRRTSRLSPVCSLQFHLTPLVKSVV